MLTSVIATVAATTLMLQSADSPAAPDWEKVGEDTLAAAKARTPIGGEAKNVILFIADGMDVTTSTAARILAGQKAGMAGEEHLLAFETLPWIALAKTYNTNVQTPDSAGTATAMVTGHKTKAGVLSVDQTVARGDCDGSKGRELPTLLDVAADTGRRIGIISTARLTHATPASLYAKSPERGWEADTDLPGTAGACTDIAAQLIAAADQYPIDVAFGGGRTNFFPDSMADPEYPEREGARGDGRNLLDEWEGLGRRNSVIWNAEQFSSLDPGRRGAVLGLFEPSHLQYEADRGGDPAGEPSLAEMTGFAIDKLAARGEGYFLMVEGGRVDHAHHAGNAARALVDTIAFDDAVATALEKTAAEDTLIIVTSDHGHTMVFQGYPSRGNPILGLARGVDSTGAPRDLALPAGDGKPFTTLAYGNGPGSPFAQPSEDGRVTRPAPTDEEVADLDYKQQAAIPAPSETHGGQDVAVYARGPQAHLIGGVVEQNYLYYVMREAMTPAQD